MAFVFPANPTVGQKYTEFGKTWEWDGEAWRGSTLTVINAAQLGGLTASQFLRSDTSGTLNGALTVTGNVTIADRIVHIGDTNTQIRFPANDTVSVETNGIERMRITSAGNVGIGTSSPLANLDVNSGVDINMSSSSAGQFRITGSGYSAALALNVQGLNIYNNSASRAVIFGTDETERMRISSAGDLLIGGTGTNIYAQTSGNGQFEYGRDTGSIRGSLMLSNNAARGWSVVYMNKFNRPTGSDRRYIDWYLNGSTIAKIYVNTAGNGVEYETSNGTGLFGLGSNTVGLFTSSTERMRIDSSGRVTMPFQPAFHARGSGTQSWSGSYNLQIPALSTAVVNRGSHYNSSTYRFTAPVTGLYFFYFKMADQTGATGPQSSFFVNGADNGEESIAYYTPYKTSTTIRLAQLSANDVAEFRVGNYNNTSFALDLSRTAFGGYLIG
jgi:hypothetical protein